MTVLFEHVPQLVAVLVSPQSTAVVKPVDVIVWQLLHGFGKQK
jgi:hypothetical protein